MSRTLAIILLAAVLGGAPACAVHGRAVYVVDVQPPPPRHVTVVARPGLVWVEGRWEWIDGQWRWHDGSWIRDRPGQTWVTGAWVRTGARWQWQAGHWKDRAPVRDHRPRVRDHR